MLFGRESHSEQRRVKNGLCGGGIVDREEEPGSRERDVRCRWTLRGRGERLKAGELPPCRDRVVSRYGICGQNERIVTVPGEARQ